MAEQITNLKVRFGADTTKFKKGMDDGKRAVQGFQKEAGSAIERFANQFGVSLGPLKNVLNQTSNAAKGMATGMKGAAGGANLFSTALKLLKVALISTGIGALVVALGTLISYFTNTQRGADKVKTVIAGFKAVFNVLIDRLSLFGEGLYKIFTGDLKGGWETLKNSVKGVGEEIKNEAVAAYELEKARQRLRDQEISLIEVQSERNKQIAQARLLAEDETVAADKRLKAIQQAQALEQKTLNENKELQKERIRIMEADIALSESTAEDYRMLAEEKAKLNDIETESLRLQKRLQTEVNSLTNEIESEAKAILKLREEQTKGFKNIKGKDISFGVELETKGLEVDKLTAGLKPALEDAKNIIIDFGEIANGVFQDLAVAFTDALGTLISGSGGFDEFGKAMLSALGGTMATVGKIIMKAGIAFFAIGTAFQKALASPAAALVAIAAGAALAAVGSAVQKSISSAGAGGGSGGTFSGNSGVYDTRTYATATPAATSQQQQNINININGTFRQRGSDMVATINETVKRSRYR